MGVPPARLTEVNSARRAAVAVLLALLLAAVGFAAPAPAPAPRPARAALEGLQASVEKAVARASRPAGFLFGRPSRAYHLKGYGAVVVLAPRALPRQRGPAGPRAQDRAFLDMMRDLERSVGEVHDPVQRRRLEETLAALREGLPAGGRRPPRPRAILVPGDIEDLQEEAEAFRREAEQAMQKAERDVMIRLRESGGRTIERSLTVAASELRQHRASNLTTELDKLRINLRRQCRNDRHGNLVDRLHTIEADIGDLLASLPER